MCMILLFKVCYAKLFPHPENQLDIKKISRSTWANFFTTTLTIGITAAFLLICFQQPLHSSLDNATNEKLTIRVNTFRRLDLLEIFLDHYETCPSIVDQVQVVWSDQVNQAPLDWEKKYSGVNVKFEIHSSNSLSNRFKMLTIPNTDAVLSIDDDLIIPCKDLMGAMKVWQSNRRALVGYSPRLTTYDIETGHAKYGRWQHTWWNGKYSLMLTKVCILHKDYLVNYVDLVPKSVLEYIDSHRNCEDLTMAHLVSKLTRIPPVWVSGTIYETGIIGGGISSGGNHFASRGLCLEMLQKELGDWPWVLSEQRAVPIGINVGDWWGMSDLYSLMRK